MSWVRYDDGFDSHPKITGVVSEDPGAIALHVLANTWSARQKRPGFVPEHQPGILVGKVRGRKWAALMEKHGLWDRVEGGWEFHDHADYRESAKRSTAGTPADLSAKRAAAGSKGGKAAQQRKQSGKQTVQQNRATDAASGASADSPVVASNEATPVPVPTTSGVATVNAGHIVAEYVRGATENGQPAPDDSLRKRVGKQAGPMLTRYDPDTLATAAYNAGAGGWNDLAVQIQRDAAATRAPGHTSNTEGHLALIARLGGTA